jgi:ribosomal-protein-alanine N-acetyltransferase
LLNITVDPQYRRQSWARKILSVMEDQASQKGFQKIFLEVRASNAPAIALYDRMGYRQVGIRKAYYPIHAGQREDALVMMKELMKESIRA